MTDSDALITITEHAALINEAKGWAMDAFNLDELPTADRALRLIKAQYDGGPVAFLSNSACLINN